MNLKHAVVALLEDLERISHSHDEVTDTDVRDSMHLALTWYFVWGHDRARFPRTFGMFSAEGDELVAGAIRKFLDVVESPELSRIPTGKARLDILQANSAVTASGAHYDEFIGHRDSPLSPTPLPEGMFAAADYDESEE
jgi:hypothetical protein